MKNWYYAALLLFCLAGCKDDEPVLSNQPISLKIIQADESTFYHTGRDTLEDMSYVFRTNAAGEIQWKNAHSLLLYATDLLQPLSDGTLLFAPLERSPIIYRYAANGDLLWEYNSQQGRVSRIIEHESELWVLNRHIQEYSFIVLDKESGQLKSARIIEDFPGGQFVDALFQYHEGSVYACNPISYDYQRMIHFTGSEEFWRRDLAGIPAHIPRKLIIRDNSFVLLLSNGEVFRFNSEGEQIAESLTIQEDLSGLIEETQEGALIIYAEDELIKLRRYTADFSTLLGSSEISLTEVGIPVADVFGTMVTTYKEGEDAKYLSFVFMDRRIRQTGIMVKIKPDGSYEKLF